MESLLVLLFANPVYPAIVGLLLIAGGASLENLIKQWLHNRHCLQIEEQKTRRLEALTRMDEPARQRLLETMPDWLDQSDPDDVEAWKKARKETLRIGQDK